MVWEAFVVNAVEVWFSPKSVWHPTIVNLGIKRKSLSVAISLLAYWFQETLICKARHCSKKVKKETWRRTVNHSEVMNYFFIKYREIFFLLLWKLIKCHCSLKEMSSEEYRSWFSFCKRGEGGCFVCSLCACPSSCYLQEEWQDQSLCNNIEPRSCHVVWGKLLLYGSAVLNPVPPSHYKTAFQRTCRKNLD